MYIKLLAKTQRLLLLKVFCFMGDMFLLATREPLVGRTKLRKYFKSRFIVCHFKNCVRIFRIRYIKNGN